MEIALHKLRHVVAVAREGSFLAAAAALPLSQSALTRSIQSLEREIGFAVFERGRSGTVLTNEGAELIRLAEGLLERSEHVAHELQALREGVRREPVRMGVGSITAMAFMPSILPKILAQNLRVQVTLESNSVLNSMLNRGELDFYIGGIPSGSDGFATVNRFAVRAVEGGQLSLLVRRGHPLLNSAFSVELIKNYPVASGSFATVNWVWPRLKELGLQALTVVADDYALLAELVRESNYLLLASGLLATLRPDLGLTVLTDFETSSNLGSRWALISRQPELMSINARKAAEIAYTYLEYAIQRSKEGRSLM